MKTGFSFQSYAVALAAASLGISFVTSVISLSRERMELVLDVLFLVQCVLVAVVSMRWGA